MITSSYNAVITENVFGQRLGYRLVFRALDFPLGSGLYVNGSGGSVDVDSGVYPTLTITERL